MALKLLPLKPWFLAVAVIGAVTAVLFLPLCGVLHRCGCQAPWSGGDAHCNVHRPQGAHCPWCEHRVLGGAALVLVPGSQLLVYRVARRRQSPTLACGVAILSLPFVSVGLAAFLWLPTDYPHFLAREARARLGLPAGPIPCVR